MLDELLDHVIEDVAGGLSVVLVEGFQPAGIYMRVRHQEHLTTNT